MRDTLGRGIAFMREVLAAPQKTEFRYRDLRFFLRYAKPIRRLGAASLLGTLVLVGLRAVIPLSGKVFLDYLVPGAGAPPPAFPVPLSLPTLLLAMLVLGAAVGVLGLVQTYLLVRFREEYTFGLQADLFDHVLRFPLSYFKSGQTGYLMSRISGDVGVMQYLFSQFLPQIISNVFYVAFSVVILYALSARLTVLLIVFTPLFLIANLLFLGRIRTVTYQEREREAHVSRDLQEVLAGIETVKAHAAEEREVGRVVATLRGVVRMRVRNAMLASLSGQSLLGTEFLLLLAVVWVGGQEVIEGAMTIGGFVAYIAYIVTFSAAARTFFSLPVVLQPVVTSAERLREIFGTEEEAGGLVPDAVEGRIAFEGVSFSYPDGTEVLRDVSFTVGPGEVVALVGRTGAGKTTLINLVLAYYAPTAGTVTLDSRDLADLDPRWVRGQVSVVSQDLFLFHTSVEENIRYGRPEAGREDIVAAARKAQVHDEVLGLPQGYETVVGERGMQLSTGQRQRIAVARAFLRDSTILVLDEPTSALDALTEERLQASLADLAEGRTVVLITHRTSLLALADRVYAIEDGRLVERAAAGEAA
ncbi:ABC transporter ATP-binding protein [Methanofollis ethanolicus]|uniref:ABC transporter ATP-binding protein n=1 Tax=Methanofollis ethanolicus TaxID=488124 RepID=UPI00082DF802|nr:ABC transporter ATP-binding protein [Methanofollis ethanolicus]